jgi:hypothetical protein
METGVDKEQDVNDHSVMVGESPPPLHNVNGALTQVTKDLLKRT